MANQLDDLIAEAASLAETCSQDLDSPTEPQTTPTREVVEETLDAVEHHLAGLEAAFQESEAEAGSSAETTTATEEVARLTEPAAPEAESASESSEASSAAISEEAARTVEAPAPPAPTGSSRSDRVARFRGGLRRMASLIIGLPLTLLRIMDLPFAGLSTQTKTFIGRLAIGTLIIAIATCLAGSYNMLRP